MTTSVTAGAIRRCAVLGSPIAHSLSPVLHRAAYAELGLAWDYGIHDLTANQLAGFVAGCAPEWRGLSMTMPLKEAALELGEVDELARLAGAGNTMIFDPDGRRRVYNTDVSGLVRALQAAGVTSPAQAVILGAGATARSALISLSRLGAEQVTVVARTPAKAAPLQSLAVAVGVRLQVQQWDQAAVTNDVLVSTAPAGAADARATDWAQASAAVFDVVYHPWPTKLASATEQLGKPVLNGLDLLVHQAVLQVELMTGATIAAEVLYRAGQAELDRRASQPDR